MYRHAASYFGDVSAQFALAKMYLAGEGVNRNVHLAVNWLVNASRKQHAPSQAVLGDLLWRGNDELRAQPAKGLALLVVALENANGSADAEWISALHARAEAEAQRQEREYLGRSVVTWLAASSLSFVQLSNP